MDDGLAPLRAIAEAALGHPVPEVLAPAGDGPFVAGSVAGDPPRARVAWVDGDGRVVARVACPPGRPSRWRPVVAAAVSLEMPPPAGERVLVARVSPEAAAVRPMLASEDAVGTGRRGRARGWCSCACPRRRP